MNCRSCGAQIKWARTIKGKPIPVEERPGGNAMITTDGTFVLTADGAGTHVSHFATCVDAWRKGGTR